MKANKYIVFYFLLLVFSTNSYSQKKLSIDFRGGLSLPISNYSSTNVSNPYAEYAKGGKCYIISLSYKIKSFFGISAVYLNQSNEFDKEAMITSAKRVYPSSSWDFKLGTLKLSGFMFGLNGSLQINKHFTINAFANVGMLKLITPRKQILETTYYPNKATLITTRNSSEINCLSYLIGQQIKYLLNKHIYIILTLDYYYSKPKFYYQESKNFLTNSTIEFKTIKIETLNLSYGLGIII